MRAFPNSSIGFCVPNEQHARGDAPPDKQHISQGRAGSLCTSQPSEEVTPMWDGGSIISLVAVVIFARDSQTAVRGTRLFYRGPGKVGHYAPGGIARQSS